MKRNVVITCLITGIILFSAFSFAEQAQFDPFPKNKGSLYEYADNNIPDICFFPKDTARWDGSGLTVQNWFLLTDFQKTAFISEYIEVYHSSIEVNGWDYLVKLNEFSSKCRGECLGYPMTEVLEELLKR